MKRSSVLSLLVERRRVEIAQRRPHERRESPSSSPAAAACACVQKPHSFWYDV